MNQGRGQGRNWGDDRSVDAQANSRSQYKGRLVRGCDCSGCALFRSWYRHHNLSQEPPHLTHEEIRNLSRIFSYQTQYYTQSPLHISSEISYAVSNVGIAKIYCAKERGFLTRVGRLRQCHQICSLWRLWDTVQSCLGVIIQPRGE